MSGKRSAAVVLVLLLFVIGASISGCDTGITESPDPGILRVVLQSNPADTSILIVNRTFVVSEGDVFMLTIFQGRAYHDSTYGILFRSPESYREEQVSYNIIARENGEYVSYVIFESHLPPAEYNRIQFGMTTSSLKLGNLEIPVKVPEDVLPFVDLYRDFRIKEGQTTELKVQISPFKSVHRYRDTYQFIPEVEIVDVKYY